MTKTIQGIRIITKLTALPSGAAAIGLYQPGGTGAPCEFHWIGQRIPVDGDGWTWLPGIIAQDGIGDIEVSTDMKQAPADSDYSGFSLVVRNTAALADTLKTAGIILTGLVAEVWEFTGTEAATVFTIATKIQQFSGVAEIPKWTAATLTIPVKSPQFRRTAEVTTTIDNGNYASVEDMVSDINAGTVRGNFPFALDEDNGKVVPASFGNLPKAKFLRTADAVIPFKMNGSTTVTNPPFPGGGYQPGTFYATNFSLPTDATQYRYLMDVTTVDPGDLQQLPVSSIADLGDFTPDTIPPGAFPPPGIGSAGQNGIGSGLYDNNGAGGGWDSYSARIASVKAGDFWTIAAAGCLWTRAVGVGDRITAKQLAPSQDETATGWLYEAAGSPNVPAGYATGINAPIAYRIKLYNQSGAGASCWQQSDDCGATWYNITPSYINAAAMHLTAIEQTYLNVIQGAGNGDQRLIARAFPYTFVAGGNPACLDWGGGVANNSYPCLSPDTAWITVYLYSVFGTTLVANINGDGRMNNGYNGGYWPPNSYWVATVPPGGQSFVQIDNNCRQYSADSWPLKGFS